MATPNIKHAFTNPKADSADTTITRPSDWNAEHTLTWTDAAIQMPNQVLNSDFSRRTVFGLAMPEVFADLSGTTKIDGGAAGSVAANIFTQGAANNEYAWCAGSFVWRDGRASATFKAVATAGIYELRWRINATDFISVKQNNGNFTLVKFIASATTVVSTVANALTLNRWYWIELDKQGTNINVRFYDTLGTVPGVTKASSTETTAARLTATVSDATVQVGAHVSITSDQAAAQWGGIATGNGGVYVETWLPESWSITHTGTLGGQAIGFDESADSGPLNKQWTLRSYVPAASRQMQGIFTSPDGSGIASTAYTASFYEKISGLGGSGALFQMAWFRMNSALASQGSSAVNDGNDASFTRKTATATTEAGTRRFQLWFSINPSSTATGTAYFMLPQLEQGSAATAWRNAPADDAPIVWFLNTALQPTFTNAAVAELDSRDLAGNVFLPWDATLKIDTVLGWQNNTAATNVQAGDVTVDGTNTEAGVSGNNLLFTTTFITAAVPLTTSATTRSQVAAGKHRVALRVKTSAGTGQIGGPARLIVTASRGK